MSTNYRVTPSGLEQITQEQFMALNLLNLLKHHKTHCNGDCAVSLGAFQPLYESLVGRKVTEEERFYFF